MFTASKQYVKLKRLGKGGFGEATLIHDAANPSKLYVVKVCNLDAISNMGKDEAQQKKLVKMTIQEAELMKSLDQPNIVKVYSSFQEGNLFHIVMEYCDSGTLKDAIRAQNGTPFQEAKVRHWTAQLALTLKYLHNRKILHRDVKTENVFLTSNGRVIKLGDFGIAKVTGDSNNSTSHGLTLATFTHMAPERWQGKPYDFKSEVWALGVVVYELMALDLPFHGIPGSAEMNFVVLMNAICSSPIKGLQETYSTELRELVLSKLLEREVAKRPEMDNVIGHPCILATIVEMTTANFNDTQQNQQVQSSNQADERAPMAQKKANSPTSQSSASSLALSDPSQKSAKSAGSASQKAPPAASVTPLPRSNPNNSGDDAMISQFRGDYWSKWDVKPAEEMPFKAPSMIFAILTVPTIVIGNARSDEEKQLQSLPSIIVICREGEIIAFSPVNKWSSIDWRCSVTAPTDLSTSIENFTIYHAAYDDETDNIYFTPSDGYYNKPYVLQANRRHLMTTAQTASSSANTAIPLGQFITTVEHVYGISVDSKRRLLFACEKIVSTISIWQIISSKDDKNSSKIPRSPSYSPVTARLMGTINCVPSPKFVATFFDIDKSSLSPADNGGKKVASSESLVKLAIQSAYDEIYLLQAELAKFNERVLGTNYDKNSGANNKIDDIFIGANQSDRSHLIIATKQENDPSALGSVDRPQEVIFDLQGNLFVADCLNKRIQIFVDVGDNRGKKNKDGKAMKAVWASQSCTNITWRVGLIPKHPQTGKPAALVNKHDVIEWYS